MLSGRVLPAHPHPLPNELFSSWLTRTAQANGIKAHSLALHLWDRETALAAWARDIDRSMTLHHLMLASVKTGIPICKVRQTTLSVFDGSLTHRVHKNTNDPFVLPCGTQHRFKTKNWLVYCPTCLREDQTPYFRLNWRIALSTVCPIHGTAMLDQCPECEKPINFVRGELGQRFVTFVRSICRCSNCGFDLRSMQPEPLWYPDDRTRAAHLSLLSQMGSTSFVFEELRLIRGVQFYPVLVFLAQFLRNSRGREIAKLLEADRHFTDLTHSGYKRALSEMSIRDRHRFLVPAIWLLCDWPDRFTHYFLQSGLVPSYFTNTSPMPYWFASRITASFHDRH